MEKEARKQEWDEKGTVRDGFTEVNRGQYPDTLEKKKTKWKREV
jgi:hypothetical protein